MSDDQQATPAAPGAPAPDSSQLDGEETGFAAAYDAVPFRVKLGVLLVAIVVVALVLGVWHDFYWHWFEVHTGTVNESGPYYGFWSGFGSDIGEATIFVGIVATWRHHNCHVKGCARLGRQVPGTPYVACPRHHPEHRGIRRSITLEELERAHKRAKGGS